MEAKTIFLPRGGGSLQELEVGRSAELAKGFVGDYGHTSNIQSVIE